jgi:hypothetical protein
MNDLTLIYYTCNHIQGYFADSVREHLLRISEGLPIISISHRPLNLGNNICVGDIGISTYNIYKQILIGAKEAKTKYICCVEDDCLYTKSHFSHRPPDDETFSYNTNRWNLDPSGVYFHRERAGMCMCIAPTKLLINTLEERFRKFPELLPKEKLTGFGEPGRDRTKKFMNEDVKIETFKSVVPTVCFNHYTGLGGRRRIMAKDTVVKYLLPWGKAEDLWKEYTANECRS